MKPLQKTLSKGKTSSEEDETFMNNSGNLIDELLGLRKIEGEGDVSEAVSKFTNTELKRLELLALKFNHTKPAGSYTGGPSSRFSH